ncbi:hypothetical protein NX029_11835 [Cytobacillus firmus]|nr:hypothetical protein [Cytobacillus firmus]
MMLSKKHKETAKDTIQAYIEFTPLTVEAINEGCCDEFAEYLNEQYTRAGLSVHQTFCTFDFISPNADYSGNCEYMKDWQENVMALLGVPSDYFQKYRKQVEAVDPRGMVLYHVWLFDGEHHYDATCLEGVKNPLELPFFQKFTKG